MEQLIITIDGKSNADLLMRLMSKFNFVKSVIRDTSARSVSKVVSKQANAVKEHFDKLNVPPPGEYNWTNPARPATEEEFELMISEAEAEYEAGLGIPAEKARALTMKKIAEWKKQNLK